MIHGKTWISLYLGPFVVDLGWFPGEPFVLLSIQVLEPVEDSDFFTIARIQVVRFVVSVGAA